MPVISLLASQSGLRQRHGNLSAAKRCLAEPRLLSRVVESLDSQSDRLAGDCAEVLKKVAQRQPRLVAPHAARLLGLLEHGNSRVRWEAAHALALAADRVPEQLQGALGRLLDVVRGDPSPVVRDYTLDVLTAYARTGPVAATEALPLLDAALTLHDSKHAVRILHRFKYLVRDVPLTRERVRLLTLPFLQDRRLRVRRAAAGVLTTLDPSAAPRPVP